MVGSPDDRWDDLVVPDGSPSRESRAEVRREAKEREALRARQRAAFNLPPERGRRPWGWMVLGLLVVALGAAAFVHWGGPGADPVAAANPTGAPVDPTDGAQAEEIEPFAGTPAESWSGWSKGLKEAKAVSVGAYSAAQVEDAQRLVRRYLKAATQDERVLFKGKLQPVLSTMDAHSREYHTTHIKSGLPDATGESWHWTFIANRFHKGDWEASRDIRTRGRIKAARLEDGDLSIPYVVTVAYWMRPAEGGPWIPVAVRREGESVFRAKDARHVRSVWMGGDGVTSSRGVCGSTWPYPQFIEAWPDRDSVATPSLQPMPQFDLSDPDADAASSCFTDTSGF